VVVGEVALQCPGLIKFAFLWQRTGSKAGGRPLFEDLVQDLVGLEHPDVATVELLRLTPETGESMRSLENLSLEALQYGRRSTL